MAVEIEQLPVAGEWMSEGKGDADGEVRSCWCLGIYVQAIG